MGSTTGLKQLEIECIVGVYEHERAKPQPIALDIELEYDFTSPARSDALGDAIDYDHVATTVTELVQQRGFRLLETMAEEIAQTLFADLKQLDTLRLEIRKPQAVPAAACSFVRISRQRLDSGDEPDTPRGIHHDD